MKPETAGFLTKANKTLVEARIMLGVGLNEAAGRSAYLACFHAAQAMLFEQLGTVLKTHRGVRTEFLRLTKDDVRADVNLRRFLARAYNLKAVADYEIGPGAEVSSALATEAVATASRFVAHVATDLLSPVALHGAGDGGEAS